MNPDEQLPRHSTQAGKPVEPGMETQTETIRDDLDPGSRSRAGRPIPPIADHELIACIGWGAYGEVWLARNVMGTCRAVKIIHRAAFDTDRPYEREFAGIQKFEPISRAHESQVDILHIGRNNELGCFFYVMELADDEDSGTQIDPIHYTPRTLKTDLQRQGRLPIKDCIEINIALTTALENLHDHGLIHRDIKPANIIFVNGRPKLADIGLVAEADSTMSYVGTAGYLPPEGPGSIQADIFSLGKVMYEMATGRDRMDFPQLPTEIDALNDGSKLFEFNEILLRACHPDLQRRYATAGALRDELMLLHGGRSVRKKRSRERFWSGLRKVAAGVVVIGLALLMMTLLGRRDASVSTFSTRPLRIDIPSSFVWSFQGAAELLDWDPNRDRIVFASYNHAHLRDGETSVTRPLEVKAQEDGWLIQANSLPRWSPDGSRFVMQMVRNVGGTEEGPEQICQLFLVSPETGETRAIGSTYSRQDSITSLAWTPDGQALTCYDSRKRLFSVSLNGGRALWLDSNVPNEQGIRLCGYSPDGRWLAFSAADPGDNTGAGSDLWLMPHLGGRAIPLTDRPGKDENAVWAPAGDRIYFLSAGGVFQGHTLGIWTLELDPETRQPRHEPQPLLVRPHQHFWRLKLSPDGRRLFYGVRESNSRVWTAPASNPDAGFPIVRGNDAVLSADGRKVFFMGETPEQTGLFQMSASGEGVPEKITDLIPLSGFQVSPDDSRMAFTANDGGRTGVFIVEVENGQARLVDEFDEWNATMPVWSPDGKWLAHTKGKVLYLTARDSRTPVPLAALYRWHGWSLRWSPDGRHIAALAYANPEEWEDETGVFVVRVDDGNVRKLTPDSENRYKEGLEWHPDGDRLTYFFYGPEAFSAKIKVAYLDGRPTTELIDQDDHWDYVGVWSPDGRQYYFHSDDCLGANKNIHVLQATTGKIEHCLRGGYLPRWSRNGSRMTWNESAEPIRYFELIESLP
jgi:Tol biopolymer transport system component